MFRVPPKALENFTIALPSLSLDEAIKAAKSQQWGKFQQKDKDMLLHHFIERDNAEMVKDLLDHKANPVDALHLAAEHNSYQVIHELCGLCKINEIMGGKTPIYVAIEHGSQNTLRSLISNKADLQIHITDKGLALWPVDYSVVLGQVECLKVLLEGEKLCSQKAGGLGSVLHLAIRFGQAEMLAYLLGLEESRQLLEISNGEGQTPLISAAALGNHLLVDILCSEGAQVNAQDAKGRSALHWAVLGRHRHVVITLLRHGADLHLFDHQTKTPVQMVSGSNDFVGKGIEALLSNLALRKKLSVQYPRNIVFAGADWKTACCALKELDQKSLLKGVRRVACAGPSVPAALLFVLGYSPIKAIQVLGDMPTEKKAFCAWIEQKIQSVTKVSNSTLGQLKRKTLCVYAKRLGKVRCFSAPDLVIADLVTAALFGGHVLRTKRPNGEIIDLKDRCEPLKLFFPIDAFDGAKFMGGASGFNPYTLGIVTGSKTVYSTVDAQRVLALRSGSNPVFIAQQAARRLFERSSFFVLPPMPEPSNKPPLKNALADFVGRKKYLEELRKYLVTPIQPQNPTVVFVLHGIGGVGKTEIACQFAHENEGAYSFIKWIDAEETIGRKQALLELAPIVGAKPDIPDLQEEVYRRLENNNYEKPWLLIFDNLEENISFPKKGGVVLITSRHAKKWPSMRGRHVQPLCLNEAVDLIRQITGDEDKKSSEILAASLGCLPLLVAHVSWSIKNHSSGSIKPYLQKLDLSSLVNQNGFERHEASLMATWKITENALKKEDPLAVQWLEVMSCLSGSPIPKVWVSKWLAWLDSRNGQLFSVEQRHHLSAEKVLDVLRDHHLVSDCDKNCIIIHRESQKIIHLLNRDREGALYSDILQLMPFLPDRSYSGIPILSLSWFSHVKFVLFESETKISQESIKEDLIPLYYKYMKWKMLFAHRYHHFGLKRLYRTDQNNIPKKEIDTSAGRSSYLDKARVALDLTVTGAVWLGARAMGMAWIPRLALIGYGAWKWRTNNEMKRRGFRLISCFSDGGLADRYLSIQQRVYPSTVPIWSDMWVDTWYLAAQEYFQANDCNKAFVYIRKAIDSIGEESSERAAKVFMLAAEICEWLRRDKQLLEYVNRAVKIVAEEWTEHALKVYVDAGRLLIKINARQEALKCLRQADRIAFCRRNLDSSYDKIWIQHNINIAEQPSCAIS